MDHLVHCVGGLVGVYVAMVVSVGAISAVWQVDPNKCPPW